MRKFLITLLIACSVNIAFSATSKSPEQPQTVPPPDERLLCQMESIGTDDYGQVYWHRTIFYDCCTGVQEGYYDYITHNWFIYGIDGDAPWDL